MSSNRVKHMTPEFMALLSGLLFAFSFPPFDIFFLAWIGWIPLWVGIQRTGWQKGFRLGYITGLVFTLISMNWIANNSGTNLLVATASMVGAVLYLSIYFGLFGFIIAGTGRRLGSVGLWLAPFYWVSIEYLFHYEKFTLAFPWLSLAMTQNFMVPILQLAEYGGIYLVSFWVMILNILVYQLEFGRLSIRNQHLLWGVMGFSIVATIIFGGVRMNILSESYDRSVRVGIVQTNLDPREKWVRSKKMQHIRDLLTLSAQARAEGAEIIVWPESAVPAHLHYYPQIDRQIRRFVQDENTSVLTGALHHERNGDEYLFYNSAFFYAPDSPVPIYSKQQLVPFGERIPLSDSFPILKNLNFGQANFESGDTALVHPMGTDSTRIPMGALICYESADPHVFHRFVENGADLMSIITNDAWLGESLGPIQHLAAGRIRAIEHRISIARSAQTGISAMFMPSGRIAAEIPLGEKGTVVVDAPVGLERSFYSRNGDLIALVIVLISAFGLLMVTFTRPRRST